MVGASARALVREKVVRVMSRDVKVEVIGRILVDCEIKRVCGNEEWLR